CHIHRARSSTAPHVRRAERCTPTGASAAFCDDDPHAMAVTRGNDVERALWALRGYDTTALGTVSAQGPHVAGVFFAPELTDDGGLQLIIATIKGSRKQREVGGGPRGPFQVPPGKSSRLGPGYGP